MHLAPGDRLHGDGPGGPLWGVLDCARDASLFPEVQRHPAEKACLFERSPRDVEAVAPWLVRLPEGSMLLDRWRSEGLDAHWGMLFRTEETLPALRRELRKQLMVTLPDGRRAVYRFFDPRVNA
jgi:hypothetical protein